MPEFYGKDLDFQWIGTAGTLSLTEYQRGATFAPSGKIDVNTTGNAGYETRMVGVKDFTASYKGLWQTGTAGTSTTTMENTLRFGESGTVIMSPEGTAIGSRKYTLPCISQGAQVNLQYDTLTEVNIAFVGNGTVTYGANT
jgi:hypothetical protein